ncbi:hypothetical protein AVEN_89743-1 [Araneus ventricosus]|uniref:Secreted protein n=1 Tax=Araneus ventricosus TaxID=182803 RepID=A0A4Y2J783_ARAVE|nr:hypothetical protein AVEN_89743-1 [Araneus ventricosus]
MIRILSCFVLAFLQSLIASSKVGNSPRVDFKSFIACRDSFMSGMSCEVLGCSSAVRLGVFSVFPAAMSAYDLLVHFDARLAMTGKALQPFYAAMCSDSPQFTHFGTGSFSLILHSLVACSPPHLMHFGFR